MKWQVDKRANQANVTSIICSSQDKMALVTFVETDNIKQLVQPIQYQNKEV